VASGNGSDESRRWWDGLWEGVGSDIRLRDRWKLTSALPTVPLRYAVRGELPGDGRYATRSEARQSVLVACALRGLSLSDVEAQIQRGDRGWLGLAGAYQTKYSHHASERLGRDWTKACEWVSQHIEFLRYPGQVGETRRA
jgi:hypothetical protein